MKSYEYCDCSKPSRYKGEMPECKANMTTAEPTPTQLLEKEMVDAGQCHPRTKVLVNTRAIQLATELEVAKKKYEELENSQCSTWHLEKILKQLADKDRECEQDKAELSKVGASNVSKLVIRHLRLLRQLNERDKPDGFASWEDYHNHIIQLRTENATLKLERDKLLETQAMPLHTCAGDNCTNETCKLIRELKRDKERLDWLQENPDLFDSGVMDDHLGEPTRKTFIAGNIADWSLARNCVREAIDSAITQGKAQG